MIAPTPWHEGDGVTLYQGDCLHILPHLAAETFDVLLTDPPYSSGGRHQSDRKKATGTKYVQTGTRIARPDFQGDNRDQRSFTLWATLWLSYCLPLLRPGRPALIFTDWRQLPSTTDALQAAGFVWRGVIPWDKGRGVRPMNGWSAQAEYVVWGTRGPVDLGHGPVYLDGHLTAPVRQAEKHHQTGKPVGMLEQLLRIAPPPRPGTRPIRRQWFHARRRPTPRPPGRRHRDRTRLPAGHREPAARTRVVRRRRGGGDR